MPPFPIDHQDPQTMTAWCQHVIASLGFVHLAKKIAVRWNPQMRTTAGRAFWPAGRIEINPRLRDVSEAEAEVERTVRHELAHLLAYARAGRKRIAPHGIEWQIACNDLGIPGESVCHRLPFERRIVTRRYLYQCPACKKNFPRVRPIRKKLACLECCRRFNGGSYDERFRLVIPP